jgi:predicted ATPase with chaperone activity
MATLTPLRKPEPPPAVLPEAPRVPEETGLSFGFLVELLVKTIFVSGELRLPELVAKTKLLPGVLEPVLAFMRAEKLCQVTRRGETEAALCFSLSELGRARAEDFRRRNRYCGAAPVSLADYVARVEQQSVTNMTVSQERLRQNFAGIVVKETVLDHLGPAVNSGRAIFFYGPAGSGKTYLAECLVGLLSGEIAVPHAIAIDGEVVQVYDPLVHGAVAADEPAADCLSRGSDADPRWVLCRRPVVMTGAELTLSMVDLEFDAQTRFYHAPQQIKANNGLLVLDDLGRQLVSPRDLMNRWIVPLDRRVDFLTLHTGQKFRVPFDVIVVFSSNLHPAQLADEAFLRRLGYKIFIGPLDAAEYRALTTQVCAQLGLPFSEEGWRYLCERHAAAEQPLLASIPRDLLGQVRDYARFYGLAPQMSPQLLAWAWDNYFARQ